MTATIADSASPPSTPSQVLLGLTRGASFRRPKERPMKNAPISADQASASRNSSRSGPCGFDIYMWASETQHGTSTKSPHSAAVKRLWAAGAKDTHRNATTHHAAVIHRNHSKACPPLRVDSHTK